MFTFDIAKKEPRGSFSLFALLGQFPLKQLQSLCDRNPRGATTLPLDEEGVPEGGGRFTLRVTNCSKILCR